MPQADFLQRSEILFGATALEKLEAAGLCLCGVGGVGSYAAEAAARSGIGRIIIIDFDHIMLSNINRQLPALHSTVGRNKAEMVRERILDINPLCRVEILQERITAENAAELVGEVDFCLDAIDDMRAKTALIKYCLRRGIGVASAMGTGNKLCPELLRIADIADTFNCPLARAVRLNLRKEGIESGVTVVFSPELPLKRAAVGSCAFVPAAAGLLLASVAVRSMLGLEINRG